MTIRRPAVPDVLIWGFAALLLIAVVVNGFATVHDTRRARLDKKVAAEWFAQHPELGRFGPPHVRVAHANDTACAARQARGGGGNPIDGYCILIKDQGTQSRTVLASYRCFYPRAAQFGHPTHPRCIGRH